MPPPHAIAYRAALRELRKSSLSPGTLDKSLSSHFRALFDKYRQTNNDVVDRDMQNAITFLRSQREYKILLERYQPLIDLTAEERIHATARRVGFDMPVTHTPKE